MSGKALDNPFNDVFKTVIRTVPEDAMSEEEIDASSCVLLTNVVLRALPFHWTTASVTKLFPFAVRLKPGLPAWMPPGDRLVKLGATGDPEPAGVRIRTVKLDLSASYTLPE